MEHNNMILIACSLLSLLVTRMGSVPADRYMPSSWVDVCQAQVSQFKPSEMTSRVVVADDVNGAASFSFGSGKSLQHPFLKTPPHDLQDMLKSFDSNSNNNNNNNNNNNYIGTTIPTSNNGFNSPESTTNSLTGAVSRTKMNNITCKISKSNSFHWKLMDLHEWQTENGINSLTSPLNRTVVFFVHVECETGANISLPWPMKTKGLQEIHVRNCGLVDQFSLANNPLVSLIPDELRVLDIRNSFWLVDLNSKNSILENTELDFINLNSDYDCGQDDSLEIYISRNVTFTSLDVFNDFGSNVTEKVENDTLSDMFSPHSRTTKRPIRPEDRLITDKEALISDRRSLEIDKIPNFDDVIFNVGNGTDSILDGNLTAKQDFFHLLKKIKNTRIQCDFAKLLVRDESLSSDTPRHLLEVSTQEATHPVLEVLNYSCVGMFEFPRELSQWRLYFPRLKYLDLSHNHISELKVENYPLMPDSPHTVVNVRYNNVSKITPDVLKSWASVEKFHVDLLHNPISCDCDLKPLLLFFQDELSFTGSMKQYEYVQHLRCHTPTYLKDRKLKSLDVDDLPCPSFESSDSLLIALAVLLGTFVLFTIILIRFKVEIRILLYTRLHVRLPCDSDVERHNKLYDAFVSYSNEDSDWVLHNLVNYLEEDAFQIMNGGGVQQNGLKTYSSSSSATTWNGSGSGDNTSRMRGRTKSNEDNTNNNAFKLCLHQRDFIPGKTIVDNIVDSIEASRHTIIVLSPSFMRSHWAMEELRQAYRQSLVEKTRHLIVVLLEKVPDEDMDPLIRRCVKTFTYLQVQDSIFRDKLVFSLTTKDRATRTRDRLASKQMSATNKYHVSSNGSKPQPTSVTGAHENFTYIHEQPSPLPADFANRHNQHRQHQQRENTNEYETIQMPSSTAAADFYCATSSSSSSQLPPPTTTYKCTKLNSSEVFLRPDYYSFPSKNHGNNDDDSPSPSTSDNGYYSLEMPRYHSSSSPSPPRLSTATSAPAAASGRSYGYENSVDLKGQQCYSNSNSNSNSNSYRPHVPSRVLSNSSTSSTTALTWNL